MVRIAGSLINGLLTSFQSIHALTGQDVSDLIEGPISNEEWCSLDLFQSILKKVEEKHSDIKGLIFRAGMEFIKGWYHFGGGEALVKQPIDFLYIQTDSQGYHSVVQGDQPDEAGWVKMVAIDHDRGYAEIHSTVPFPPEFSQGVFVGGMQLMDGFDFVNVEVKEEPSTIEHLFAAKLFIRFKEKEVLPEQSVEAYLKKEKSTPENNWLNTLYWKYKGLDRQIAYEQIYQNQLNTILVKTTEDVRKKNVELSRVVDELQTTQDQLVEQEKMASLGQLTAGVAHEINNPVNFVKNNAVVLEMDFAELSPLLQQLQAFKKNSDEAATLSALKDTLNSIDLQELQAEINQLINAIQNGSERIATIVSSLQYLSYTDHDNKSPVDIREPIEATLTILHNKMKGEIELVKEFADCPPILINAAQMNQVFINILNNGIQAIDGKGQICIRTRCQQQYLFIEISDSGSGIDPAIRNKIFEPFFTTKKIGEGTGLGLSISYGIIQGHQGKIEVDSQLGTGTTFTIKLPY